MYIFILLFIYFSSDFPFNQSRTRKSRNTNTTCHIRLQRRHYEIGEKKQFSEIFYLIIQSYIFRIKKRNFATPENLSNKYFPDFFLKKTSWFSQPELRHLSPRLRIFDRRTPRPRFQRPDFQIWRGPSKQTSRIIIIHNARILIS